MRVGAHRVKRRHVIIRIVGAQLIGIVCLTLAVLFIVPVVAAIGVGALGRSDWMAAVVGGVVSPVCVILAIVFLMDAMRVVRAERMKRFHVDRRCPRCRYDLRAQTRHGCPECGWGRGS